MNIIPIAIPMLHNTPIAVSSLTLILSLMVPIPVADIILKGIAARIKDLSKMFQKNRDIDYVRLIVV